MLWAGSLGVWLQGVSDNARSNAGKLIPLLLSIPCFKLSNALFKAVYLRQQRRFRLLGVQCAFLGGENYALEFEDLPLFLDRPAYVKERLRRVLTVAFANRAEDRPELAAGCSDSL